ncbi:protein APEM9 [Andrographis paniculata]|uniref:protein APEM9 n=1 Tax=Andrographis paniculata TaxID=175694 RepID=UPI0021E927DE|nr:protein APEM9 [Andrographis paniculata]
MKELVQLWDEIERAESCLVCCLFDEAASLASSILRRLIENRNPSDGGLEVLEDYENEWSDMVESAGMVLVQSMKQLRRTSEIVKDLKLLFGSLSAIPVQVFLSGICFQMSESPSTSVQSSLEEFLNGWKYVDGQYYPILDAEASGSDSEGSSFRSSIGVDEYLEVVELHVIKLLAMTLKDTDHAISWVEKTLLPMEKRQELLRRLQSMNTSKVTSSSQTSRLSQQANGSKSNISQLYNGQHGNIESKHISPRQKTAKEEILQMSQQRLPYLQWFPTFSFKIGNTHIAVPNRKLLLVSFLLLVYYSSRKKHAALKRFLVETAMSWKRGLVDLWQLAFSYQVNPLAAVQSLPTPPHGNR